MAADIKEQMKRAKAVISKFGQSIAGEKPSLNVDNVNSPAHYTQGNIDCIEAIEAALGSSGFKAYCTGNALKYLWRWKAKNGVEDLRKADWYINRLIDELEGGEE